METATASSVDWTSIINNTVNQVPSWIAIARNQPVPPTGTGVQGGAVMLSPSGVSASFSPGLIIAAVVGLVAVVYLLKK
jgi:hypothetical protein